MNEAVFMNGFPVFQQNKKLSELCTFGIGGPARFFVEIRKIEEMQNLLSFCQKEALRYMILGKGSNCLFDDQGFNGLIILNKIDFIERPSQGTFHVGAGYSFSLLGAQTARQGFAGLEFASGIPGSVGGAIFMNAGANGCETSDSLTSIDYISENGDSQTLKKEEVYFAYRTSSFQKMKGAIVGATFCLTQDLHARQKQLEIINYRKKTQPYRDKSAGCIFRNPNNGHAGAIIEKCDLKGSFVGGAKVSNMHANFIVNAENASSVNVLNLIQYVKQYVKDKTGIELESEIRHIPFEGI